MVVECCSPAKVNLLLNILGKRDDNFHELETLMHPIPVYDHLRFERKGSGIQLSCDRLGLPVDSSNLIWRAADGFFQDARLNGEGISIHLEKRIPLAAGLGGGSGNAAITLMSLNQLFGQPLKPEQLFKIAAQLGSDVPFFLQGNPALATGRGEQVIPLNAFSVLEDVSIFLVHPGFGVSTAWAYQHLAEYPEALNGKPGRAGLLAEALRQQGGSIRRELFYNSLEAPVMAKYPLLQIYKEFMLENGALVALMSGSGSTTFALIGSFTQALQLQEVFKSKFGGSAWTFAAPLNKLKELESPLRKITPQ